MSNADASPSETLAQAAAAGIHCIPVPTPFLVGRINCYLIEDDPLTLVDTGPNSGTAFDVLEQELAKLGRKVEEIELIVLTHQHVDHMGLVGMLQRRSGAQVAAFAPLVQWIADYSGSAARDDEYAQSMMRRHGVPENLVVALGAVAGAYRSFGARGTVEHPLSDGDELALRDRTFTICHRPGHSPSDILLWDQSREQILAGDHLLGHISSNPLISRPLVGPDEQFPRPQPLVDYITSMKATDQIPAALILPGHGDPVADHHALIAERLHLHERRARKILKMLADGPLTGHEIATRMWGSIAMTQTYLTLSEVLGHTDLLLEAGQATELDDGEVVRFVAVS
jgi:glyoxylase-like metal-dependent hydrolase (beta-lactamase superfamily II)